MMRLWVLAAILLTLAGCGGLPDDYESILELERGESNSVYCADPSAGPVLVEIVVFENSGAHDVEILSVSGWDSLGDEVEAYVVHTPLSESISFGSHSPENVGAGEWDALDAAWENRTFPPGVVPIGTTGNVLVLLSPPPDGEDTRYVSEFEITVEVDGRTKTYPWEAFRIIGDQDACDEIPPS